MSTSIKRREFMAGAAATALAAGLLAAAPAHAAEKRQAKPAPYKAPDRETALAATQVLNLEKEAEKVIPPGAFAYIARGSEKEWTLRENIAAFDRISLIPKYLSGQAKPDLTT